jgi:hypothetical protein
MKLVGPIVAVGMFCFPSLALAQVAISFDDQAPGPLSAQYSSQGTTFNFPLIRDYSQTPGSVRSGNQAVELCFAIEFCQAPLVVNFTTGQRRVKLYVGLTSQLAQPNTARLRALDRNGIVVTEAFAVLGPSTGPIPVHVPLEVISPSGRNRQVTAGFVVIGRRTSPIVMSTVSYPTALKFRVCGGRQWHVSLTHLD